MSGTVPRVGEKLVGDNHRYTHLYGDCRFEIQIRRHGSNGKEPRGLRHALPGPEDCGGDYHLGGQIASSSLGMRGGFEKATLPQLAHHAPFRHSTSGSGFRRSTTRSWADRLTRSRWLLIRPISRIKIRSRGIQLVGPQPEFLP